MLALLAIVFAVGVSLTFVAATSAAPVTFVDDAGADDEPGQKDLNFLTVDYASATSLSVNWGWDDTATSGNNTRDGCALLDTDGDNFANYSFCVIVATDGSVTSVLYSCGDGANDRCNNPRTPVASTSSFAASIVTNSDPFGPGKPDEDPAHAAGNACDANPGCNTDDTVAVTTINFSDLGGATSADLLNVCSYPSGVPGSDPSDCVFAPDNGLLTLVKVVDNLGETGPAYKGVSDFPLTIDGTATTSGTAVSVPSGNHTIAETSQTGYSVGTWTCDDGTTGTAGSVSATVNLSPSETVVCTMTNTLVAAPAVSITKTATEQSYDSVGDVINYTIVATNTGNVTRNLTVTDPNVSNLSCTPANGSAVAPGGTMTCTASHTVTQADIDAGFYANTACVNATGATQACDSENVPADQNPELSITKVATEQSFDSVGDVINYTIVATNTGNTTLASVTVTDPGVTGLSCTPSNGSSLAPGASMTCTASHTVTQGDIDAGFYANTACADDGPSGATEVCDSENVPAAQNPALTVVKSSTTTLITVAGQVVPYSYLVTNTGNVTLTGITVTDDKVASVTCPVTTLAPGASTTCTGSYTVTAADITAGGNLTNLATACGDPPTGSEVCDTDTLSIPIEPPPPVGHIFHTGVTCSDFLAGGAELELENAEYVVKSGKVNNVAPGVMFYYISLTAPSADFTITVPQENDGGWKVMPVQAVNQIILYESNCSKSRKGSSSFNTTTGTATITVTGATPGATYIVGIKYSLSGLAGQTVTGPPYPTVEYSFSTSINGGLVASSQDSITVTPKP